MLEIRPNCEHCGMSLENTSELAMICTFECTFCKTCVDDILHNVCPNCGGGFEKRPTRPKIHLKTAPVSNKKIYKPVDMNAFNKRLIAYQKIDPRKR
ncbi:MAG: DUF1272 domain-containing protein [Bacteroidia bacterium]